MPPGPASQLHRNKANCLFGAYQKDARLAVDGAIVLTQMQSSFFFSQARPDAD